MPSYVRWFPEKLNARLLSAFRSSVGDAKNVAMGASPTHDRRAGAKYRLITPTHATLGTTGPLGHIFEGGRKGGYPIQPGVKTTRSRVAGGSRFERVASGVRAGSGKTFIAFHKGGISHPQWTGTYYSGPGFLGGPAAAKPYIRPAATVWARTLYQRRARAAIRGFAGF